MLTAALARNQQLADDNARLRHQLGDERSDQDPIR
jgi:hypothetical protein